MSYLSFIKESVKNLRTTGTVTRSSQSTCRAMVSFTDFENARYIVELGAGDGVVTHHILNLMRTDAKLLCFEVNNLFCKQLKDIDDERLIVIQDSAEKLIDYMRQYDIDEVDSIISAIPFVALNKSTTRNVLSTCQQVLKTGGSFSQIHYSLVLKNIYKEIFEGINIKFVLKNIPPAFIMYKIKE